MCRIRMKGNLKKSRRANTEKRNQQEKKEDEEKKDMVMWDIAWERNRR